MYVNEPRKNIHNIYRKEMIINAYNFGSALLPIEAFVAPVGFNPDAQELNIHKVFSEYVVTNPNARCIFSLNSTISSIELAAIVGTTYAVSENSGNYNTVVSGIVNFSAGSTKRHVIVINSSTAIPVTTPQGTIWVYFGNFTCTLFSNYGYYPQAILYVHCFDINSIKALGGNCFMYAEIGTVNIPTQITTIPGAFANGTIQNLILHSGVIKINGWAFYNAKSININCHAITPPIIEDPEWTTYGTLHIPLGSKSVYIANPIWARFTIIDDL